MKDLEAYKQSFEKLIWNMQTKSAGLTKDELIQTAEMIHEAKSACVLWAMGITQHIGGSDGIVQPFPICY